MKRFHVCMAALLLAFAPLQATGQEKAGKKVKTRGHDGWTELRASYDRTFISDCPTGTYKRRGAFNGAQFGILRAIKMNSRSLYLETGGSLLYAQQRKYDALIPAGKESSVDFIDGRKYAWTLGFKVPVNIVYKIELNRVNLLPYGGFYGKFLFLGKTKVSPSEDKKTLFAGSYSLDCFKQGDMGDEKWNRFLFGCQCGLNFEFNDQVIGFGYAHDLNRLCKTQEWGTLFVNFGLYFSR